MKIISGCAANIELETPPDLMVRPTLGRTRKALFDHLGDFTNLRVLDLFSGSGALGLEAASRGAAYVASFERDESHARLIERNIGKVLRTGCQAEIELFRRDALSVAETLPPQKFDLVFSDPPYEKSAEFCRKLLADQKFMQLIRGAKVIWEIPDNPGAVGEFLDLELPEDGCFRKFGVTTFYLGVWQK